jgi:hypothetical protein
LILKNKEHLLLNTLLENSAEIERRAQRTKAKAKLK